MSELIDHLRSKTIMLNMSDVSKALFEAADRIEELEAQLEQSRYNAELYKCNADSLKARVDEFISKEEDKP